MFNRTTSTLGVLCVFARVILYPIFSSWRQACPEPFLCQDKLRRRDAKTAKKNIFLFLRTWRPLRLAPWNILSTEALSFHSRHYFTGRAPWNILSTEALSFHSRHYFTGRAPWNTYSTKIELFARSAIPWGKSPFIRFPKPKFICNPEKDVPALFRTRPSIA